MSPETPRNPVVLIVDDDDAFREHHGPGIAKKIFGDTIDVKVAANVQDAARVLRDLARDDAELVLLLIDMHMPESSSNNEISTDAGKTILTMLAIVDRYFRVLRSKAVIYTAYPSFEDCVACLRAGAADYVPKKHPDPAVPQGPAYLIERCKKLLAPPREGVLSEQWRHWNLGWLQAKYAGKWVGFVSEAAGRSCGLDGEVRDGVMLLAHDDYYDLLDVLIEHNVFLHELLTTWRLPSSDDIDDAEGEQ